MLKFIYLCLLCACLLNLSFILRAEEVVAPDEALVDVPDDRNYVVERVDPEDFTLNDRIYDPKTSCDVSPGDHMRFIEENPADCVEAHLYNFRTHTVCAVWCE